MRDWGFTWLLALAAACLGLFVHAPACASEMLYSRSCLLPADTELSVAEARSATAWICGAATEAAETKHAWLRLSGTEHFPSGVAVNLRSDGAAFFGLLTAVRLSDGTVRTHYWDGAELARNWTAGSRFAIPLYEAGEHPVELLMRIDRPLSRHVAVQAELVPRGEVMAYREAGMIWFAIFFGMSIVAAVYSVVMAVGLRHVVALYQSAISVMIALYTFSASSLVFALLPGVSMVQRTNLSYISMALATATLVPFSLTFLERNAVHPAIRRFLYACCLVMALNALLVPLAREEFGFFARQLYHLIYLPMLLGLIVMLASAVIRRSRAVRFLLFAWSIPALSGFDRAFRGMDLYTLKYSADFVFFGALALETVVIAVGVAWRVSEIRRARDLALAHERELSRLAATDELTGLPNRRAFDQRRWRAGDYLAIVDADRFKQINDTYGHQTGDDVLRAIGAGLASEVERGSLVGAWRLGGEEFAVLLAARRAEDAALTLNAVRERASAAVRTAVSAIAHPVTLSAGLAAVGTDGIEAAYRAADRALYQAKTGGRDRLCYEAAGQEVATMFPRPKAA